MSRGRSVSFFAEGIPRAKGSKTRIGPRLVEVADMATKTRAAGALSRWVQTVAQEARRTRATAFPGGVHVTMHFVLPRPRRPAHDYPAAPDLDKAARAINDALTGVLWANDNQVVELAASKRYAADGERHGAAIEVREANHA